MGSGSWTTCSYTAYSKSTGKRVNLDGTISNDVSAQEMFVNRHLAEELNPKGVIRECCDSEEHPNTVPVILALDVTGSMGRTAVEVASKLNKIMTTLYGEVTDVQFMIMGIGDFAYDRAPLQVSQFESDVRIAEQLDKIYFESGGGGNDFESYTSAWYFADRHTKLDCWKRGKKGLIITIGDEMLNPYIPHIPLSSVTGDNLQGDVNTNDLYESVSQKYEIYHLDVYHGHRWNDDKVLPSFAKVIGESHARRTDINSITNDIINIIKEHANKGASTVVEETVAPTNDAPLTV